MIVVVPAATAVAMPAALMVATAGTLEVQVTELVMFWVERTFRVAEGSDGGELRRLAYGESLGRRGNLDGIQTLAAQPITMEQIKPREPRQRGKSPRTERRANI